MDGAADLWRWSSPHRFQWKHRLFPPLKKKNRSWPLLWFACPSFTVSHQVATQCRCLWAGSVPFEKKESVLFDSGLGDQGRLQRERVFISVKICLVCWQTDNWCWLQLEWFHHGLFLESDSGFDYGSENLASSLSCLGAPDHWGRNHFFILSLQKKKKRRNSCDEYRLCVITIKTVLCDCSLLWFQNWSGVDC